MTIADTDREARKVLWTTLVFATVCSLATNITHSIRLHHGGWAAVGPVLLAMLAPVALLILFHLLGVWAGRAGYRSATYWVFLAAILGLGAAAFRLSFAAIRDLAMEWGYGYGDAALFPLILDGLIAVCTVGLVAVQRPRKVAHQLNAETTVVTVQQPAIHPAPQPEPPTAERTTAPADRTTAVMVEQPEPQAVHETVEQAVNHPVNWDDADTEPLADHPAAKVNHQPEPEVDHDPQPTPEPVVHRTLSLVGQSADRDVDHRAIARRVVERSTSGWSVDQVEAVSRLTPGPGQRVIAEELDVSPTTVNRIRKAIAGVIEETEREEVPAN